MGKTVGYDGQERERQAPDDVPVCIQRTCHSWLSRQYTPDSAQYGHVPAWWNKQELFDHVSHHLIIDAMEALKVLPVLVAVWIRECSGHGALVVADNCWIIAMSPAELKCIARFHLLSWNVACFSSGPPLAMDGACSKPAKAFAKFLRDLERSLLVNSLHARLHFVNRRNGH